MGSPLIPVKQSEFHAMTRSNSSLVVTGFSKARTGQNLPHLQQDIFPHGLGQEALDVIRPQHFITTNSVHPFRFAIPFEHP